MSEDGTPPSRLQLPPGTWPSLIDGLCARFPRVPRAEWASRFARGRVQDAAGHALAPGLAYRPGMEVLYYREVADEPRIPFEARIVHQDAHLLVADKPHFLPVTPAGGFVAQTLLARLRASTGLDTLVPLHRIDRGTAGLVMFSVEPATRARYQTLFPGRRIEKTYEALAPPPTGRMPASRHSRIEAGEPFFRMREVDGPPNSETHIEVLARESPDTWRYRLRPVTGRKHQLRVHMAALGAPILNDPFYPDLLPASGHDFSRPLKLLARSLRFLDPIDGRERVFESDRTL
ncbi:pseudouridine synthase [Marilutibacter aestuarii]|uniref:Pseudouridine synthase n=1 Tax=Marilutibacter aestuarii TaxID=1706195 RepID=A0A508AGM5_9GAMM|nr:pseudouridine synthase [Lysobacter aestuarii]TQD47584.1 pseudouridine synthase [Lysobacter aestuarii]